jgi:hypothetical protein
LPDGEPIWAWPREAACGKRCMRTRSSPRTGPRNT